MRVFNFQTLLRIIGAVTSVLITLLIAMPSARGAAAVKPVPAFKKGMFTVVFEVNVTPEKVITKCKVSKVQDPNKVPAVVVKFTVTQKYRQAACKIIAENIHDPRVMVTDPYYTYLMVDPAHPDIVIPR